MGSQFIVSKKRRYANYMLISERRFPDKIFKIDSKLIL